MYFSPSIRPRRMYSFTKGTFFQVKGPLNSTRPPQGYPVFIQAGASDTGRDLAATDCRNQSSRFSRTWRPPGFSPPICGGARQVRARSRPRQDPSRPLPDRRLNRRRGQDEARPAQRTGQSRLGAESSGRAHGAGPLGLSARWPCADAAALDHHAGPRDHAGRNRAPAEHDAARAARFRRHEHGSQADLRHARADRGRSGRVVQRRSRAWLQSAAAVVSGRLRRLRRPCGSCSAKARTVPDRVQRPHAA